jgi:hypothetical protein
MQSRNGWLGDLRWIYREFLEAEMKTGKLVRGIVVSLAVLGMCLPGMAFAASPAPAPAVVDVAMADGGVLHGQLVDLQGGNAAGVPVAVKAQNQQVLRTTTLKDGHFTVEGLRGGVYQVAAGQGQGVYRLWTAKAAPPSAQKHAIVFTAGGGAKMLLANPIVIAGVVATAVAVPVAVANSRPSSP